MKKLGNTQKPNSRELVKYIIINRILGCKKKKNGESCMRCGNIFSEKKQGKRLHPMLPFRIKMSKTKTVCSYWADKHVKNNFKKAILAVVSKLDFQSASSL